MKAVSVLRPPSVLLGKEILTKRRRASSTAAGEGGNLERDAAMVWEVHVGSEEA